MTASWGLTINPLPCPWREPGQESGINLKIKKGRKTQMIENLTPHPIVVRGIEEETVFPPSGVIPRVGTIETPSQAIEDIPTVTQAMGTVEGLPEAEEGIFLLVSAMVFNASDRRDLIAPDTGKGAIRDKKGRILAVTRFVRKE